MGSEMCIRDRIENDGSLEDLQEAVRAYWEAKIQPQLEAARGERV